jgi:anti-anti-sigma regulatory factor
MPVFTAPKTPRSAPLPSATGRVAACGLALDHYRPTPRTVVVSADGDIDASNVGDLLTLVRDSVGSCDGLIVDLSRVGFFGTEGLSALIAFGRGDTTSCRTAVVPSPAVTRLLRLCTPAPPLLLAPNLNAALVAVQTSRPVLALVTEPLL